MVGRTGALRKHKNAKPGGRYRNYWCSRAHQFHAACTYMNGHSARMLEAAILDHLGQYSSPEKVKELLAASERNEIERREKDLRQVERRLAELEGRLQEEAGLPETRHPVFRAEFDSS